MYKLTKLFFIGFMIISLNVCAFASEKSDTPQALLKLQLKQGKKSLTKDDINALSMGRNSNGKFGVEIWLTQRFVDKLDSAMKNGVALQTFKLEINGKVIQADIIKSSIGARFEVAHLSMDQANTLLKELSADYDIDVR